MLMPETTIGLTVRTTVCEGPLERAAIVAVALLVTFLVVTVNCPVLELLRWNGVDTVAAAELLLEQITSTPLTGALPLRVTVAVTVVAP